MPQMLHSLGVLSLCPGLDARLRRQEALESGHTWEMQLRGCSIWAVELLRRQILLSHPEAEGVNAVLIDFWLYDSAKELELHERGEPSGRWSSTSALHPAANRRPMQSSPSRSPSFPTDHRRQIVVSSACETNRVLRANHSLVPIGAATIPHHRTRSVWY